MEATSMTPKALRELADKIEKSSKAIKEGFLKHDLYNFFYDYDPGKVLFTEEEAENLKKQVSDAIKMVVPIGAKVYCFKDRYGESWSDDSGYISNENENWADKNLIEIRKIK